MADEYGAGWDGVLHTTISKTDIDEMAERLHRQASEGGASWAPISCKHEWRQYMETVEEAEKRGRTFPNLTLLVALVPDGYFCIHCTERRD